MSDDARVHLRADKSHVQAYLEYLRVSQRSHSDPLLSEAEYAKAMEQSGGAVERRRKMTEAEEMAVYEKNYQARRKLEAAQRRGAGRGSSNGPARVAGVMAGGIPLAVQDMYMQLESEGCESGAGGDSSSGFVLPWERYNDPEPPAAQRGARATAGQESRPAATRRQAGTSDSAGRGRGRGQGRARGRGDGARAATGPTRTTARVPARQSKSKPPASAQRAPTRERPPWQS